MRVAWNKEKERFQQEWIWKFGEGPFEVLQVIPVPTTPRMLGVFEGHQAEIRWEPGRWFYIKISDDSDFRVTHNVVSTRFHSKWFRFIYDD